MRCHSWCPLLLLQVARHYAGGRALPQAAGSARHTGRFRQAQAHRPIRAFPPSAAQIALSHCRQLPHLAPCAVRPCHTQAMSTEAAGAASSAAAAGAAGASRSATLPPGSGPGSSKFTTPLKAGVLSKLGGGGGGRKNWKKRYFVLTDHLAYYESEAAYKKNKEPKGVITLNAYYCSKTDNEAEHEFTVHAYPKPLTCRAPSAEELEDWISVLLEPLREFAET